MAAVFLVVANAIFTQTLIKKLAQYAPSVSPEAAFQAGSSSDAVRKLVAPDKPWELNGVLDAYSESLRNIWLMLVAFASLSFLFSFGMGWIDVRKVKGGQAAKEVQESEQVSSAGEREKEEV